MYPLCYVGRISFSISIPENLLSLLAACGFDTLDTFKKCFRIKWNAFAFTAREYSKAAQTVNYVALVNIKGVVKIVSLEYFLIAENENSVLYIAKEIQCSENWTIFPERECSQLMRVMKVVNIT